MIIFQIHAQRQNREIPPNFLEDTLPVFSKFARELIRVIDQKLPDLNRETRRGIIHAIDDSIPRNHYNVDGRIRIQSPPSQETISLVIQEIRNFTAKIETGQLNTQNLEAINNLIRNRDMNLRTAIAVETIQSRDQNIREFVDREIANEQRTSTGLAHRITRIVQIAEGLGSRSEREAYLLIGQMIQNRDAREQRSRFAEAGSILETHGVEGLRFLEYNTRSQSPRELPEIIQMYRRRRREFSFQSAQNMITIIRGIRTFESELMGAARAQWGEDASFRVPIHRFDFSSEILQGRKNFGQLTVQAMQTMNELGLDHNNRELLFNFIYAISTIGEVATRELHNRTGIVHFARYTRHTLEEVLSNIVNTNRDQRPVALLAMNREADWNGAFYAQSEQIETLTRGYRLIIVENSTDQELFRRTIEAATRLGPIRALGFGGHGNAQSIQVGPDITNPSHMINISDTRNIGLLLGQNILTQDAAIFLMACKTGDTQNGQPIGQQISNSLEGRKLFAPNQPTRLDHFEFDQSGMIIDVVYGDPAAREQFQGRITPRRVQ